MFKVCRDFTPPNPVASNVTPRSPGARLLDVSFAIFGYSMGALIAFELAHQLRADSIRTPLRLMVASARAPHLPRAHQTVSGLPDREFLKRVDELNGIPAEVRDNPELMKILLPTLRADMELCDRYKFHQQQRLDCPISAYGGDSDKSVRPKHLAAWEAHTRSDFSWQIFPGDHFFMTRSPKLVLKSIAEELFTSALEARD
jgi:surfactin synthase thioesterase subunit